jgi:hypothetical protein
MKGASSYEHSILSSSGCGYFGQFLRDTHSHSRRGQYIHWATSHSTAAKNVIVITDDKGAVTLRGPVKSSTEQEAIERIQAAFKHAILEVKPEAKLPF